MMTKKHVWRVKKEYFHQLKSGEKSLEIRVGYSQIKKVKKGDTITSMYCVLAYTTALRGCSK